MFRPAMKRPVLFSRPVHSVAPGITTNPTPIKNKRQPTTSPYLHQSTQLGISVTWKTWFEEVVWVPGSVVSPTVEKIPP